MAFMPPQLGLRKLRQQAFNEFFARHGSLSSVLGIPHFSVDRLGETAFSSPHIDQQLHLREDGDWEDEDFEVCQDNPNADDYDPYEMEMDATDMDHLMDESIRRQIEREIEDEYLEDLQTDPEPLDQEEVNYRLARDSQLRKQRDDQAVEDEEDDWEDD